MKKSARTLAVTAVIGLALVGAACSESAEDLSDEELRTELIDVLTEDGTLTDEQASCSVDFLFDNLDRDTLNDVANAQQADEISEDAFAVVQEAFIGCLTPTE